MFRWLPVVPAALALAGLTAAPAPAQDRSAEEILQAIQAVQMPTVDMQAYRAMSPEDQAKYRNDYSAKLNAAQVKQAELIGELAKVDPTNPILNQLLPMRWQALMGASSGNQAKLEDLRKEIDGYAAGGGRLAATAAYFNTLVVLQFSQDQEAIVKAVESFIEKYPQDQRAPGVLSIGALRVDDPDVALAFNKKLIEIFPDSREAQRAKGSLRQLEAVGKPFEFEFTDAISGKVISNKTLKGKVIVVDFWATWCGPCVAEMPNMKKIYAQYKDQGVEFIGVSLDQPVEQGGLEALKTFVKENEITWPQYYQGNYWQSEFSSSWGINAIPAIFVVDAEGNLFSTNARGKLETILPELLKKAKAGTGETK
jgi:thiol-disulfide isomerase/thioredoxin